MKTGKQTTLFIMTATAIALSELYKGQVGINNNAPKATLDITAKTSGSNPEGLIIPQLSGDQIRIATTATPIPVYGAAQKGLIIYASAADSSPSVATANITAPGYYYFDGSVWQKIAAGSTLSNSLASGNIYVGNASNVATPVTPSGDMTISNTGVTSIGTGKVTSAQIADGTIANADLSSGVGGIYKGSGSLSGNTTVAQGTNTLAFNSSVTNGFSVAGSTFSVDGANSRVGIGTTGPLTTLDVNGNMRIATTSSSSSSSNVATLVWDNTTGEIKIASSSTGNTSNMTYIKYVIANVNKDWISSFNTNIPSNQYTVVVVGSTFDQQVLFSGITPPSGTPTANGTYNPLNVAAFDSGGTWKLSADYNGGGSANNGTWTIFCLVINNSIIKTLPDVTANLGGSNTGSAAVPSGL